MYRCTHEGSHVRWTASVHALKTCPETRNTDPEITNIFADKLLYILEEGNELPQRPNLSLHSDILHIGWPYIILCFITKSLSSTQQTHYHKYRKQKNMTQMGQPTHHKNLETRLCSMDPPQ